MKQTARIIPTYTGDTSGACSALYELGGLLVMHDAAGCNATYSAFDEPRWDTQDSLVFVSGLTETEAILGDDSRLIDETIAAAKEFKPNFVALVGSPIPMITAVDFQALAFEIENEIALPTFGFDTTGMHSYISGASLAFSALAQKICRPNTPADAPTLNILGATPLDFGLNHSISAMQSFLKAAGWQVQSVWAMDSDLSAIAESSRAQVNLVISACGLAAAKVLQQRFGTPYVMGVPSYWHSCTQRLPNSNRQPWPTSQKLKIPLLLGKVWPPTLWHRH